MRRYEKPMRPGDTIHAIDRWLGVEEKSKPDRPYRLFTTTSERTYINQRDEPLCTVTASLLSTATPPGQIEEMSSTLFSSRQRRCYSSEELAQVEQSYTEELNGSNRRGAQTRYWEDVHVGEQLPAVFKGPYDISDAAAIMGAMGRSNAFASKWRMIRNNPNSPQDPVTRARRFVIDWHFDDSMAQVRGVPYAAAVGTHLETMFSHPVTMWMGDDGFLRRLESRIRAVVFHGDICKITGHVSRTYRENGESLVELELASETITGVKYGNAKATVKLPSRT